MSARAITPWFQNASPLRPGVYRTSATWGKGFDTWVNGGYSYWDGRVWYKRCGSPKLARAAFTAGLAALFPPVAWRGILISTKGTKA